MHEQFNINLYIDIIEYTTWMDNDDKPKRENIIYGEYNLSSSKV